MLRRSIALTLLVAQASAVVHLAVEAHTLNAEGAVVDAQPRCADEHGYDGVSHGHASADDDGCAAQALLLRTEPPWSAFAFILAAPAEARFFLRLARGAVPVSVLAVAPKASPPA